MDSYASEIIGTPLGKVQVRYSGKGLKELTFGNGNGSRSKRTQTQAEKRMAKQLRTALKSYFDGDRRALSKIPVEPEGTRFQMQVWTALQRIPAGKTLSYADVSKKIGKPKAVRAVGTACGKNPICLVVPCHRVVSSNGGLGGFSAGLWRKKALLKHETGRPA